MPTPHDIIAHCDTTGNLMLDRDEVHHCVNEMVGDAETAAMINDEIDAQWEYIAGEDSEIDEDELSAMIMDHCDKSGNRMLDQHEVHECINEMVGEPDSIEINDMIDEYWTYIAGDDLEIDEKELSLMMGGGPESLIQNDINGRWESLPVELEQVFTNEPVVIIDLTGDEAFPSTTFALVVRSTDCIQEYDSDEVFNYPEIIIPFVVEAYHCHA